MLAAALHGLLLSIALIMPIGMQNGFLLSQGAMHKRWLGAAPAVVAAALCDTLLIALAVLGVSAAAFHIIWLRLAFGIVGICFLLYMGWATWREEPRDTDQGDQGVWNIKRQVTFAASVSLLNPHALLDTLAVIGGSATVYTAWSTKLAFGAACAAVSWIWFFVLMTIGHMASRAAAGMGTKRIINRLSALMMCASAVYLGYILSTFR
ncbi:L-lysine exporter family protein LysE/ArgO [Alicyclobacillus sacchari]|uniref:L-lysine exporter family protein LysE/ArgO n=1 Tax=Alicyclobacillus sacchari TaxID=392010 RepID=A0A4R8LLL5_9BACL|nr:LysE family transporter [Alicyclobacillus sacchari]TDY46240.1 L-lysine exporter family protein LysE/ArgO [Alicyclobacillus sacchari]